MNRISSEDLWKLRALQAEENLARSALSLAAKTAEESSKALADAVSKIKDDYGLDDGDQIDKITGEISKGQ